MTRLLPLIAILFLFSCSPQNSQAVDSEITEYIPLQVGAERMAEYLPLLEGKRVGLVVNQTSVVHKTHLVDTLLSLGVQIQKVMAPEHGFRGEAPDGQKIEDAKDEKTGIPIVSIYGSKKKELEETLGSINEDNNLQEFIDEGKIQAVQKEIALYEKYYMNAEANYNNMK